VKISCCWLYAISKYGYPPSIENTYRAVKEMKKLGFEYIELEGVREKNLNEVYQERKGLKKYCDDLGLKVINFCPVLADLVSLDKAKRKKALQLFDRAVEIANYFYCETIQTDSYIPSLKFKGEVPYKEMISYGKQFQVVIEPQFSWEHQWNAIVESLSRCNEKAKQADLKMCLEPRVGENVANTDSLLRLFDRIKDGNFGAVLDTGHLHAQKELLPLSVEKLGKRIFYLHVSDNNGLVNEHRALGRGTIDWDGVFTALKKYEFEGYVAVDVGRVENLDEEITESVKFLGDIARKFKI